MDRDLLRSAKRETGRDAKLVRQARGEIEADRRFLDQGNSRLLTSRISIIDSIPRSRPYAQRLLPFPSPIPVVTPSSPSFPSFYSLDPFKILPKQCLSL